MPMARITQGVRRRGRLRWMPSSMDVALISLADRPDIFSRPDDFRDAWPEFMYHDCVSSLFYDQVVTAHPEHCLVAVDRDGPVARAFSFPFHWTAEPEEALPAGHD